MPQNDALANYSFLPWVRSGLGNEIVERDALGANLPNNPDFERPRVTVEATLKASQGENSEEAKITKETQIQGPGDVLGINGRQIIRAHPKPNVTNFETNNLCYLEFYEEDLPWRFTPARPHVSGKLRPWLALIVLRTDEFTRNSQGGTPTPTISINPDSLGDIFYDEEDQYAMAHVHVLEDLGQNNGNEANQLKEKLARNPDLALSRVLCPRKLEYTEPTAEQTAVEANKYTAFLIPAFEVGRLAGLGEDTSATPAQQPSWSKAAIASQNNPTQYPYYFNWSFSVGPNGDFETLAELLTARELPEEIGRRAMNLTDMGYDLSPTGQNATAFVEGAMKHPDYQTASWPKNNRDLQNRLRNLLNLSADLESLTRTQPTFASTSNTSFFSRADLGDDPIVVPPTYGKWHRGTVMLGSSSDWVNELNMSPSHRAAAGLGTRVVQENQEEFMEMAWEQIGDINQANQKIIETELAKRAAAAILRKKLNRFDEVDLIAAGGKAFERLRGQNGTLKKELKLSRVPTAMRAGTFTRLTKVFTPGVLAQATNAGSQAILQPSLLARLNNDDEENRISAAPVRAQPAGVLASGMVASAITTLLANQPLTFMEEVAEAIKNSGGRNFNKLNALNSLPSRFTPAERDRAESIFDAIKRPLKNAEATADPNDEVVDLEATLDPKDFEDLINTSFDEGIYRGIKFIKAAPAAEPMLFSQNVLNAQRLEFKVEFDNLFMDSNTLSLASRTLAPAFDVANIKDIIKTRLNPKVNFGRILQGFFTEPLVNQNKPIMAYPRFPLPMYSYLRDIAPDYIIPNIADIEPNTITLMEPNKKFIEAFLTGMNHEFSRELLWREFPTDMRGSYFRHFWEYDNAPRPDQQPTETVEDYTQRLLSHQNENVDINELHTWGGKRLGLNHNGGPQLVLLVKGDIFKKYPNTLVYAQKAKFKPGDKDAQRQLDAYNETNVKWPILRGQLEPDVYFFGFDISETEANGNRTTNAGYFFVLREIPGQVSFGLDDYDADNILSPQPDNWDEVTWQHITNNIHLAPPYLKIEDTNLNLSAGGSGPRNAQWGAGSAHMAYILYQAPVLFARHASTMLTD